jgi:hypothetical protein
MAVSLTYRPPKIEYTYCELETGKVARVLRTDFVQEKGHCVLFALLGKGGVESVDYLYPDDFYQLFKLINDHD